MYKLTHSGHRGTWILFETPNQKEMAAYIFYCGYYKQPVEMDSYIDLYLPDGKSIATQKMDKWVEEVMPKETDEHQKKLQKDTGLIRNKLIQKGIIKSYYVNYLEKSGHNRQFFSKKMENRQIVKST